MALLSVRNVIRTYPIHIISLLLGMVGGYVIIHPYTMLVNALMHIHDETELHFHWSDMFKAVTAFDPRMAPMAVAFVAFGGMIGILFSIIINRRRKLIEAEYENERNEVAIETLKELMVTLSHHLLNSNMIIGGKVRHIRKLISDKDTISSLAVIEKEGRKIDAVIRSLREVTEIKTADYTSSGEVQMFDIGEEIEDHLKETPK